MYEGKLFRQIDIAKWDEQRLLDFFGYTDHFRTLEDGVPHFRVNQKKLDEMLQTTNPFWQEINKRIGKDKSPAFYLKFATQVRMVCQFLRNHPSYVTKQVENKVKGHPQMEWCLEYAEAQKTDMGIEVVTANNIVPEGRKTVQIPTKNPEQVFLNSLMKVTDVFYEIAASIKKGDITDMDVQEKINSLSKLSFILNIAKSYKPNRVFQQFNIYQADRDTLEKNILKYATENEQSAE